MLKNHVTELDNWLRGQDSNLRPSDYEPDELPDRSTPQYLSGNIDVSYTIFYKLAKAKCI